MKEDISKKPTVELIERIEKIEKELYKLSLEYERTRLELIKRVPTLEKYEEYKSKEKIKNDRYN